MRPPRNPTDAALPTGRLSAKVVPRAQVTQAMRRQMFALFERYYDHVDEATFCRDMDAKDEVILMRDSGDGSIRGFCTLVVYHGEHEGRRYRALFTGDTIVDKPYWGQSVFHQVFFARWGQLALRAPGEPFYWLLITKGYKTYLAMTRNCPEHWPRHDAPTPPWEQGMMRELSSRLFGAAYLPELGLVREGEQQPRLKPGIADAQEVHGEAPDARFFLALNPEHERGDQLVCVARMTAWTIPYVALRHSKRALERSWSRGLGLGRGRRV